ncbi:MAG: HlyC/CorC family transporter [Dehalococcoidales bacterium]|nr:HlyC/CorC family transporter [Dehalococcoidales bacterium]
MHYIYYIVFVLCLLLAAFFCSAETAFISIQKLRLQHLVRTGNRAAGVVARIVGKPEKFLATVLFGINLFETAVATIGTIIAISFWGEDLGAVIATIIITLVTMILAELIPKSLSARHAEKLALLYARPIEVISVVFYPFVFLLSHIGIRMTKLTSEHAKVKPTMSEEEFHTAIDIGEEEGVVEERAAEMLHNVFDFTDSTAREVMIPRTDVIFIEKGSSIKDFMKAYAASPLSRYPVFEERRDNVMGILSSKDILIAIAKEEITKEAIIDSYIRPAHFAPETKHTGELLREMQEKNIHLCVVVDEFGGTAGIITIDQLIAEIVGQMGDELASAEKDFEAIDAHTYEIDGSMRINEANEEMQLNLPEGDYETVAGFILSLLRRIPKTNEQLRYKDLKIIVKEMQGVKIERILVTRESHATPPD